MRASVVRDRARQVHPQKNDPHPPPTPTPKYASAFRYDSALEVADPRRPIDVRVQLPPCLLPLMFLLLSFFPVLPGFPNHLAPIRRPLRYVVVVVARLDRPWRYLAGDVARLGPLHVLPRWCCVRDAEGGALCLLRLCTNRQGEFPALLVLISCDLLENN